MALPLNQFPTQYQTAPVVQEALDAARLVQQQQQALNNAPVAQPNPGMQQQVSVPNAGTTPTPITGATSSSIAPTAAAPNNQQIVGNAQNNTNNAAATVQENSSNLGGQTQVAPQQQIAPVTNDQTSFMERVLNSLSGNTADNPTLKDPNYKGMSVEERDKRGWLAISSILGQLGAAISPQNSWQNAAGSLFSQLSSGQIEGLNTDSEKKANAAQATQYMNAAAGNGATTNSSVTSSQSPLGNSQLSAPLQRVFDNEISISLDNANKELKNALAGFHTY